MRGQEEIEKEKNDEETNSSDDDEIPFSKSNKPNLLQKIFSTNAQNVIQDEIELVPIKLKGHRYAIDLVSCNRRYCVSVDINDQVLVWDLENSGQFVTKLCLNNEISAFHKNVSIW